MIRIINFLLCLACLLSTLSAVSQRPIYKHFSTKNGLPHDITYQIIQDSKGFIWVGTDDGLTKFNGTSFKNYSYEDGLKSNYVIDIIEKNTNEFLLATWGAGLHTLKNDTIYKTPIKNDDFTKINKIYALNDSTIYGTRKGSFILYNTYQKSKKGYSLVKSKKTQKIVLKKTPLLLNDNPYLNEAKLINGHLYLYATIASIRNLSKKLKGLYTLKNSTLKKCNYTLLNNIEIHSIDIKDNYLFVASFDNIFMYNEKELIDKRTLNIKNEKIIHLQVKNQALYFTTYNFADGTRKLYSYDWNNNVLVNISKKLKIKSFVSDFLLDKNSGLWITTYGQGIFYIPSFSNYFFNEDYFENPDLKDLNIINESIITLAPNKVYEIKNDSIISKKTIPFHVEQFQIEKKDNTVKLISPFHTKYKEKTSKYNIISNKAKSFIFHNDSTTIKLLNNYIHTYQNNKLISTKVVHKKGGTIKNALQYNNKIYVIYNKVGLYIFDAFTGEKIDIWNKKNGFYTNDFKDIIVKDTTIWLASSVGIIKINKKSKQHITTNHGLSGNHVNDILLDSHGVIWLATQKGLNLIKDGKIYSIGENLGQYSSFVTKVIEFNNYIYATGNNGLFKLNNLTPFSPKENTKLYINQKETAFSLNTINYLNPKSISVAYQLNGAAWKNTSEEKINFSNLTQGKYSIQFRYKDSLSDWRYSKKYFFKITYPWHKQTWFYVVITIAILGMISLLLLWNLQRSNNKNKQLKKSIAENEQLQNTLKEVRKNVARDFHDELGNKLASISITSNLLTDTNYNKDKESQKKKINQIKKDADYLYHGMKDFVWALDHKNDDLHQLQMYLNDFGENLFENSTISFYSTNNFGAKKTILPFYWSKQIVLIFKEAMTNALKHSNASKVTLSFELVNFLLKITLKDNGDGFNSNELKRVNGIKNMKFRTESINQEIFFNTKNGVVITFIGNLKEEKNA